MNSLSKIKYNLYSKFYIKLRITLEEQELQKIMFEFCGLASHVTQKYNGGAQKVGTVLKIYQQKCT